MITIIETAQEKIDDMKDAVVDNSDTLIAGASIIAGIGMTLACFWGYYRCIRNGVRDGINASRAGRR